MKALAIERPGSVADAALREVPRPEPQRGEVAVAVRAAALNPADVKVAGGELAARFLKARRFPLILGYDFAGVVDAVGSGVSSFGEGDRVFGFVPYSRKTEVGTIAERLCVAADQIARIPDKVDFAEAAACATVAATALQGLRDAGGLAAGKRVLVNGASGGVGSFAVQIARALGAEVTGTCSAGNVDFVAGLGASEVLDYRETSLGDTGGDFAVVLDAAATSSFLECRKLIEPGGAYVTLLPGPGWLAGKLASLVSSKRCHFITVQPRPADFERIAAWIAAGDLEVAIAERTPMARAAEALARQEAGGFAGKLVIDVAG